MAVASNSGPARSVDLAPLAILVNLQTASVTGFAPVGLDAERYGEWLHGAAPVPEVAAHHAAHHAGDDDLGALASQVDASGLDVSGMVALARELGAGELVAIAPDPDGGTWPIAEALLDAARAAGLRTGLALDPGRDASTLIEVLVPDTVRRLGDGSAPTTLGEGPDATRLVDARRALPDVAPDRPWELRLGAGPSLGWNRAEVIEDLRTPRQLIDRFARTLRRAVACCSTSRSGPTARRHRCTSTRCAPRLRGSPTTRPGCRATAASTWTATTPCGTSPRRAR